MVRTSLGRNFGGILTHITLNKVRSVGGGGM